MYMAAFHIVQEQIPDSKRPRQRSTARAQGRKLRKQKSAQSVIYLAFHFLSPVSELSVRYKRSFSAHPSASFVRYKPFAFLLSVTQKPSFYLAPFHLTMDSRKIIVLLAVLAVAQQAQATGEELSPFGRREEGRGSTPSRQGSAVAHATRSRCPSNREDLSLYSAILSSRSVVAYSKPLNASKKVVRN